MSTSNEESETEKGTGTEREGETSRAWEERQERDRTPTTNELSALEKELKLLKRRTRKLSKGSRRRLGRSSGIRFSETETSASSATSDASTHSDSSTSSNDRKRKKKKRKNKNNMSRLHKTQQGVLKGLVERVTKGDEPQDVGIRTLSNTFSKKMIHDAIKNERKRNYFDNTSSEVQVAVAPKLDKNRPANAKNNKDAVSMLKDMVSTRITGEEVEGIHEYLSTCARVATSSRLNFDQFYDLAKSRIDAKSTLYREVTNNYRNRTSLKELFKELCATYTGGSSYLSCLRRYNEFNGNGMSASQFISKLKNIAHDLTHASQETEDVAAAIYKSVKDKTMALLPSLAPDLLEGYRMDKRGSNKGDLVIFTGSFMKLADKAEQLLQQKGKANKTINMLQEHNPNSGHTDRRNKDDREHLHGSGGGTTHRYTTDLSTDEEPEPVQLILQLKLSRDDMKKLKDKCYKCGSESPFQSKHFSAECVLYKGDPLAMYMCSLCNIGVHLPSVCKQSTQGKASLEEKAKELGIPLTTETVDGKVYAIVEKNC